MNEIISTAEQIAIATRAHAAIGSYVEIDGRGYRVARWAYELRFFGVARFQGENPPSTHVACLRSDLAVAQTLPCEYQDRDLARRCEKLVSSVLSRC